MATAQVHVRRAAAQDLRLPRTGLAIAVGGLIYMALMFVGQSVAQGVVEEKSTRVVELLLSTLRPWSSWPASPGHRPAGPDPGCWSRRSADRGVSTGALGLSVSTADGTVAGLAWYRLGFTLYALVFAAGAAPSPGRRTRAAVLPTMTPLIVA